MTHGLLADRAIVPTSSNEAFEQAIDVTGNAAIIVHFGLPNAGDVIHVPALSTHTMDKEIRFSWLAPGVWPTAIRCDQRRAWSTWSRWSASAVPLAQAAAAIRAPEGARQRPGQGPSYPHRYWCSGRRP